MTISPGDFILEKGSKAHTLLLLIKGQAATGKQADAGYVQFDTGTVSGPVHSICDSPCKKQGGMKMTPPPFATAAPASCGS